MHHDGQWALERCALICNTKSIDPWGNKDNIIHIKFWKLNTNTSYFGMGIAKVQKCELKLLIIVDILIRISIGAWKKQIALEDETEFRLE